MNHLKIKYGIDEWIEVDISDYIYFTGGNRYIKHRIIQSLNRFKDRKSLNELEENIYGESGLEVIYNSRTLKTKDVLLLHINDLNSFLNEMILTRKNLIYDELLELQHDLEINMQVEEINNQLFMLETLISKKMVGLGEDIGYEFTEVLFETLIKNHLELAYYDEDTPIPIQYMNPELLVSTFIELIERFMTRTGKLVWLIFDQPFDYLSEKSAKLLFSKLSKIASETNLLHFFVFNQQPLLYNLHLETEKIVLLYRDYQQLPELDIFRASIERHYPDIYNGENLELRQSFQRICHLIGANVRDSYSLAPKDMILLMIVKDLLGDNSMMEPSIQRLSTLEKSFLTNKV